MQKFGALSEEEGVALTTVVYVQLGGDDFKDLRAVRASNKGDLLLPCKELTQQGELLFPFHMLHYTPRLLLAQEVLRYLRSKLI